MSPIEEVPDGPAFRPAFWSHDADVDGDRYSLWTSTLTDDRYGNSTRPGDNSRRIKYRAYRDLTARRGSSSVSPAAAPASTRGGTSVLRDQLS